MFPFSFSILGLILLNKVKIHKKIKMTSAGRSKRRFRQHVVCSFKNKPNLYILKRMFYVRKMFRTLVHWDLNNVIMNGTFH